MVILFLIEKSSTLPPSKSNASRLSLRVDECSSNGYPESDMLQPLSYVELIGAGVLMDLPGRFLDTWKFAFQSLQTELEPAETESAENTTATPGLETPVVDSCRTGIAGEGVELELCLGSNFGGKCSIVGQVAERLADDFCRGHGGPSLHISDNAGTRHGRVEQREILRDH